MRAGQLTQLAQIIRDVLQTPRLADEYRQTESLQMGCVAYSQAFFAEGLITPQAFERAMAAARKEVMAIATAYRETGWDNVVGSSGTIKAARQILLSQGWSDEQERLTQRGLLKLRDLLRKGGDHESF